MYLCRDNGVFEEEYFSWLDTQIAKAPDPEAKYVSSLGLLGCDLNQPHYSEATVLSFQPDICWVVCNTSQRSRKLTSGCCWCSEGFLPFFERI